MGLVNQELVLFNKIIFANSAYAKGRNHAILEKIKKQLSWQMLTSVTCSLVAYKRLEQSKVFSILISLYFLLFQVNYYFFFLQTKC